MQTQSSTALFFAERAREITEFCVREGRGHCFLGWPVPTVFAYAFHHSVTRTVFSTRAHGAVTGVLFAWGQPERDIRDTAAAGKPVFHWQRSQDQADSLFLAEVIADPSHLARLIKLAGQRWPEWQRKKIFTFRHGQLVELKPETIERLSYGRR